MPDTQYPHPYSRGAETDIFVRSANNYMCVNIRAIAKANKNENVTAATIFFAANILCKRLMAFRMQSNGTGEELKSTSCR